jgi:hypothetical protein
MCRLTAARVRSWDYVPLTAERLRRSAKHAGAAGFLNYLRYADCTVAEGYPQSAKLTGRNTDAVN